MGIRVSIFLIALGAILTFATDVSVSGLDLDVVGIVLMLVGALGLILTMLVWGPRRRRVAPAEVVEELGECHYGAWTGRPIAELVSEPLWRTVQDDPSTARFPDSERYAAESLAEMSDRITSAVRRIDAEQANLA